MVLREYTIISLNYNIGFLWSLISPRINQLLVFMYHFLNPHFFLHFLQSTSIFQHIFSKNFLAKKQINCFQMNTQVVFTISLKSQFFLLFSLFLLLFMDLLHFLILFMDFTVLFQLLFSFIYSTFSKKIDKLFPNEHLGCVYHQLKKLVFLLFSLFLLLFMDLLHFLILFLDFTILFQLSFSFNYSTFNKKFSISVK